MCMPMHKCYHFLQLKRRNTLHGAKLATVTHEYENKRNSFHTRRKRSERRRRKLSTDFSPPSEGVTQLMVSCQQELEHDITSILHKKVSHSMFYYLGLLFDRKPIFLS